MSPDFGPASSVWGAPACDIFLPAMAAGLCAGSWPGDSTIATMLKTESGKLIRFIASPIPYLCSRSVLSKLLSYLFFAYGTQ
jgi:hypothetical protein